jgi:ABC-type uncharacterized transport system ATPase subunit
MSLNVSNLTVHHGAICAVNQVSLAVPTGKLQLLDQMVQEKQLCCAPYRV